MKLTPLHDWAVVRQISEEEMTAGGLYIPDSAKVKPAEGVVEAIGPGAYEEEKYGRKKKEQKERKFIPTTVKPGDVVLYERYAGHTVDVQGQERVLVREREILGIMTGRPEPRKAPEQPLRIPAQTSGQVSAVPAKVGQKAIVAVSKPAKAPAKPKKAAAKKAAKPAGKKSAKPAKKAAPKKVGKKTTKKKR